MLAGLMIGTITTIMNHKLKKPLNNPEVADTQGVLFTFFISSLFGGFYSACLTPVGPFGVDQAVLNGNTLGWTENESLRWISADRDRFEQGGFQVLGTVVSGGIGTVTGLAVGLLYRLTTALEAEEVFNDVVLAEVGDEG